jgi:dipeptidyl aminopeptidase/acylaminoacyl peptidase
MDCSGSLAWSTDGTQAAWTQCAGALSIANRVFVHSVADAATWAVGAALGDPTIERLHFTPSGKALLLQISERTDTRLVLAPIDGKPTKTLGDDFGVYGQLKPVGKLWVGAYSDPTHRADLVTVDAKGRRELLYRANPQLDDFDLGELTVVNWTNSEDTDLEGLLYLPPEAEGPQTLMVMPHGGPDSVSMRGFNSWARYFVSRGYAVFQPNYRGGTAYGLAHYAANRGRLGQIEQIDIESGVDQLIADGIADPERLVYGGWSWGGYLTAWTIGHTDRYKAAVAGAAVVDVVNQYVMSDINHGVIAEWEYTGNPWTGLEHYDAADPSRSLGNVTTPTLVLHGDADTRVTFASGLTLYRALSDIGVDTDLWVYPGSGHGPHLTAQRVHVVEAWADWYDTHLE